MFKITEISTVRDVRYSHSLTYILVDFWRAWREFSLGHTPVLTNDLLMQLRVTTERIVTRDDGWLQLTNGSYVDPGEQGIPGFALAEFKRETVTTDLPAQIQGNIEAYYDRAVAAGITGDHTSDATKPLYKKGKAVVQRPTAPVKRDQSDPMGVLARQDVKALVGTALEMRP